MVETGTPKGHWPRIILGRVYEMCRRSVRRYRFHIGGQVQGVGFRPFAYRLATSGGLTGFVINEASGATIEVQGQPEDLDAFARRLSEELPPLAEIVQCRQERLPVRAGENSFEIHSSRAGELTDAQVTVDTVTCADCLRELFDPADPRHGYPFINCTNCGPRYTIIKRIPYDRPNTTMADFAMCSLCASQYAQPQDRRFHAQPIACPRCGPSCWLTDSRGKQVVCDDAVVAAADILRRSRIVAIKGLGGFHLACRADEEHVIRRLRMRKNRDAKPFALMVKDLSRARQLCRLDANAERLMTGPQCPILVLPRRTDPELRLAEGVAPGLSTLGIMLPYTPLHHMLLAGDLPPLVMTSGNVSDEPLVKDNDDAIAHLGRIADAFLLHNRRIQRSIDDSVVQVDTDGAVAVIRRARGYAPRPVQIHQRNASHPHSVSVQAEPAPVVLAVGGELKNTICLYKDGRAVASEHIGDLKDGRVYRHFMQVINDLELLFDLQPEAIAADLHPQYLSTEYALRRSAGELAGRPALPLVQVQHHHAHIASCMAEHGLTDEVIGLACDGTGYGTDGAIWGCEILRASLTESHRVGHLRYFPLPGGDAGAIETARPALSLLLETFGRQSADMPIARSLFRDPRRLAEIFEQIAAGLRCPPTSSLGRLFDAVAALCGLAEANRYEGQAPMLLEAAAAENVQREYAFALTEADPFEIDCRAMVEGIVRDLEHAITPKVVSAKFHNTVATFLAAAAARARETTGLNRVALSGGCFANRYVRTRLRRLLEESGFEVLTHENIPCNDGGVSLGQAVVAAYRLGHTNVRQKGNSRRLLSEPSGLQKRSGHVPGGTGKD